MKAIIGTIALGFLVSACANGTGAVPAAEIQSMSDNDISVVYYDSVSGMNRAGQIAASHCDTRNAMVTGKSDGGATPDKTVVAYHCK